MREKCNVCGKVEDDVRDHEARVHALACGTDVLSHNGKDARNDRQQTTWYPRDFQ